MTSFQNDIFPTQGKQYKLLHLSCLALVWTKHHLRTGKTIIFFNVLPVICKTTKYSCGHV